MARRTCGITAAAMGMSLHLPEVEPLEVLKKAASLHKVPSKMKNYWLRLSVDREQMMLPVGQLLDDSLLQAIKAEALELISDSEKNEAEYRPVFSLANGYDHRGSKELFAAFGVRAEMLGDKDKPLDLDGLRRVMRSGAMFMASVTNSITPWMNFSGGGPNTHVLLLTDIVQLGGAEWYHIVDPYSPNSLKAIFYQPVEGFHGIEFNGFGTVIYPSGV